ncbi:MAG: hypothetical protein R2854_15055 [Caldilineaceae bacterium]
MGPAEQAKRTLLAILAGCATPSRGEIRMDGRAVDPAELAQIARLASDAADIEPSAEIALILLHEPTPAPTRGSAPTHAPPAMRGGHCRDPSLSPLLTL